jgi:hypothetical protein
MRRSPAKHTENNTAPCPISVSTQATHSEIITINEGCRFSCHRYVALYKDYYCIVNRFRQCMAEEKIDGLKENVSETVGYISHHCFCMLVMRT